MRLSTHDGNILRLIFNFIFKYILDYPAAARFLFHLAFLSWATNMVPLVNVSHIILQVREVSKQHARFFHLLLKFILHTSLQFVFLADWVVFFVNLHLKHFKLFR